MHAATVLAALVAGLLVVSAALAGRERIHLTLIGQRAAHRAVLKRVDLGRGVWLGTRRTPVISTASGCPGFRPKQSDLIVVGAAETVWKRADMEIDSEAQVLRTRKMVQLDWSRSVHAPKVLRCLRHNMASRLGAGEKLAWITRLPVPRLPALARLYRAVITVQTKSGKTPVMVDAMLIGAHRTEIGLTVTAQYAERKDVTRAELRLARILIRRAR